MNQFIRTTIVLLLCSTGSFAQSKKEVNKQLNSELLQMQQQHGALEAQHDSLYAVLNDHKAEITEKCRVLQTRQTAEKELSESVRKRYDKLRRLDHKSTADSIITFEQWKLMKTEAHYIQQSAMKEVFKQPFEPVQVDEQQDLVTTMKLKEQNVYISGLIEEYRIAIAQNNDLIKREINTATKLTDISTEIDSIYAQSDVFIQQLDRKNNDLQAQLYKLRLNYMQKGPNGFSEAYADVFADVYYEFFAHSDEPPMQEEVHSSYESDYMREPVKMPVAEPPREPAIFEVVEVTAQFPGGASAMKEYLQKSFILPESVRSGKVKGKCYLKFIVSTSGYISNVKVVKGVPDCPECDAEALRVVRTMPDWIPAKNNGTPVNCYFTLPISFNP